MIRRWILLIISVLFVWVVLSHTADLKQLGHTLRQGQVSWVLAAFFVLVAYFVVFTGSYQAAFYTVGIRTRTRDMLPVTLGSLFINVVVPVGGTGGAALFTEDLSRRGESQASATAGVLLQLIADFSAFALLLIPGMIYLFIAHDLQSYEIVTAAILLLITISLVAVLALGVWKPDWLQRLFRSAQRLVNWLLTRLRRSHGLSDDWAQKNAGEFSQAATAASRHPLRLALTILVALLAHLLDLAVLYLLFLAFHQPVGLGELVAGYAMGILFLVVSITPQGIGVVEGIMALTFTSLGIPTAVAATVTLAFRGLTFWLPVLLGFFAMQRLRRFNPKEQSLIETWGVRILAVLVGLMGVINVLSAVTPSLMNRLQFLEQYMPLEVQRGGHLVAALAGFALIVLAFALARRKRLAWILTLIVLTLSIISHMLKGLDYEESLFAAGLIALLLVMRDHFHARSDPPSVRQGLWVLLASLTFTLAYGIAGFYLLDRHFSVNFGLWAATRQTVVMFTQFYDPGLQPVTHFGRFFANSIYLVGAATFGYALYMLLRPVFIRRPASAAERVQARVIVEKYGHSSLARMLLFDDKRYFFTPGGSVIGYALVGRIAVALGDPVGPPADLRSAVQGFKDLCERNDWMPVFYQTLPESLPLYLSISLDALCIGYEGIVNLVEFKLEGKEGKPLRAPINKLTKAGYTFAVHRPPISDELLAELRTISDEWLTTMHGTEKRFSLGWFDDDYIRSSPIAAVHAPEGWISAFANIVPEYQANEVGIDLMRRRKEMENGTMEFLFVFLFEWAKASGCQTFNLGLSALFGVGEGEDDPAIERVLHFVYENINQFYNFKGLHAFKEKFHPTWSPRYLIYPGAANLASAWLAVVRANSGLR
ncbi:MAG: hypothetical protein H6Q37_948 [Chloroflexi bacterium]|nr:hypothetical protein [Chloroflexota bacterium]